MNERKEMWYDIDSDKYYLLTKGNKLRCNSMGKQIKSFIPYCTGYKTRTLNSSPRASLDHEYKSPYNPQSLQKMQGVKQKNLGNFHTINISKSTSFKRSKLNGWNSVSSSSPYNNTKVNFSTSVKSSVSENNGLRLKKRLWNSNLGKKYINAINTTFHSFRNLKGFSSKMVKLLNNKIETDKEFRSKQTSKSYHEVIKLIEEERKQDIDDSYDFDRIKSKVIIVSKITLPTESDLYIKAKKFRKLVNKKASINELQLEELDLKLLKERREQRILKLRNSKNYFKS